MIEIWQNAFLSFSFTRSQPSFSILSRGSLCIWRASWLEGLANTRLPSSTKMSSPFYDPQMLQELCKTSIICSHASGWQAAPRCSEGQRLTGGVSAGAGVHRGDRAAAAGGGGAAEERGGPARGAARPRGHVHRQLPGGWHPAPHAHTVLPEAAGVRAGALARPRAALGRHHPPPQPHARPAPGPLQARANLMF